MTPEALAVLGALPREPIYAVLDGARDPRIRRFIGDTRAPAWCLYRGNLPAALEDAAPWLLRLVPGMEYVDRLFERGWNQAWGILLTSPLRSRELRRHLRKFLQARTEDGRILVFRYYDPRILRVFLPSCDKDQLSEFFGPVTAFVAEDEDEGAPHLFRPDGGKLDHRRIDLAPPAVERRGVEAR